MNTYFILSLLYYHIIASYYFIISCICLFSFKSAAFFIVAFLALFCIVFCMLICLCVCCMLYYNFVCFMFIVIECKRSRQSPGRPPLDRRQRAQQLHDGCGLREVRCARDGMCDAGAAGREGRGAWGGVRVPSADLLAGNWIMGTRRASRAATRIN